jgi:hypothetical protein
MEYPPEWYYGIDGEHDRWIRQDAVDTATAFYAGGMGGPSKKDIEKHLRIEPVIGRTERLAAEGVPEYDLIYMEKGVTPIRVLPAGVYWAPDKTKKKQALVSEAMEGVRQEEERVKRRKTHKPQSMKEGF